VHFTQALTQLVWQCSDLASEIEGLAARLALESSERTPPPLVLDVAAAPWPLPAPSADRAVDAVFTANTLHIMSVEHVGHFFARVGEVLAPGGLLCVYGPLKYKGAFTTPSNAEFDEWLRARNPLSGIRDFEALDALAAGQELGLVEDIAMPANNQLLVWRRAPL
jgi:SAM-dependent methyltransferase